MGEGGAETSSINLADRNEGATHLGGEEDIVQFDISVRLTVQYVNGHVPFTNCGKQFLVCSGNRVRGGSIYSLTTDVDTGSYGS